MTEGVIVAMRNRDRYILKVNEHDMLLNIQTNLIKGCRCVLDGLTGEFRACPQEWGSPKTKLEACSKCIQDFLNEES
jgi:hypothetical protein